MYSGILDTEMIEELYDPSSLRERPKGLEKLVRFRVSANWVLPEFVSCSAPLYMYYKSLLSIGQINIAKDLWCLLGIIKHRWKIFVSTTRDKHILSDPWKYVDDYFRMNLKAISGFCFPRIFSHGPSYMLFTHLHALTGKAPHTKQQILDDIAVWCSDNIDGKPKNFDTQTVEEVFNEVFTSGGWSGEPDGHLDFEEYCNDFYRWGTNGGAPRSELYGTSYRTKWAWAFQRACDAELDLKERYDLYSDSLKESQVAKVALKEEAQKTREIIATPLSSYLRQCYLLYRWGKPPLPSPISSSSWVGRFEGLDYRWYGCLDGEGFDQSVPKWFVLEVVRRLGQLDEECRAVAAAELKHLEGLVIEWSGERWRWKGGILSGWRLTSLLGTLASVCAARFICRQTGLTGAIDIGALGDDLILGSYNNAISTEKLVSLYTNFGLRANMKKTTSGPVGEFLRKVYSKVGVYGYPALALRSIMYANPWISGYQFDKEQELANTWWTYVSRLAIHQTVGSRLQEFALSSMSLHLTQQFGRHPWKTWLRTPISCGGGGCIETSVFEEWTELKHVGLDANAPRYNIIPRLLGVLKSKLLFSKVPSFIPFDPKIVNDVYREVRGAPIAPSVPFFKKSVNSVRTMYEFARGSITRSELNARLAFSLPRSLRGSKPEDILTFLVMGNDSQTGYTSIRHSKESAAVNSDLTKYVSRAVNYNRKFLNSRYIRPAVTVYFMQTFRNVRLTAGSW